MTSDKGPKENGANACCAPVIKESPAPSGQKWNQSSINGNRKRGTGILNNDLYRGLLIWNRQRFLKDPSTGKRVTRMNPESEWIQKPMPAWRIVDQALWNTVKDRQGKLDLQKPGLWRSNRPQYLLSGLMRCGQCGGGYAKISKTHYGCSAARNQGETACTNRLTIRRFKVEGWVLAALQHHLMRDDMITLFCQEYTRHMNKLVAAHNKALKAIQAQQTKLAREKDNMIQALRDGIPADVVKEALAKIEEQQQSLKQQQLRIADEPRPFLHPAMAKRYQQ